MSGPQNDLFADTDRNHTNGVALTAVSHDIAGRLRTECLPAPARLHAQLIGWLTPDVWTDGSRRAQTQNVVVKFGQSMHTPADPLRIDLVANDRPHAGPLYVGMSWTRYSHDAAGATERLDTREITIGVIGPWSLAEQAQKMVHDAIGVARFLGWDRQLKNEPALQRAVDRRFKGCRGPGAITPGGSSDAIRSVGLRLRGPHAQPASNCRSTKGRMPPCR